MFIVCVCVCVGGGGGGRAQEGQTYPGAKGEWVKLLLQQLEEGAHLRMRHVQDIAARLVRCVCVRESVCE
jgi:hypothetical protein